MSKVAQLMLAAILWLGALHEAQSVEIALIGDPSKYAAFQQLSREFEAKVAETGALRRATSADRSVTITVARQGQDPVATANQLLTSDVALLVVDATQGALPIVREHVLVARQSNVPLTAVFFARTRELLGASPGDARELLELEELEMRELLSVYKMGGAQSLFFFDTDVARVNASKTGDGTAALRRFIASKLPSRAPAEKTQPVREFAGTYYLLTELEGRERNRAVTVTNGTKLDVWIAGSSSVAVARTTARHEPGDAPGFALRMQTPIDAAEGMRLMLLRDGMVVGVGVVAKIVR